MRKTGRPALLTPEREAVLRRMWPDGEVSVPEIWQAVNALPGQPWRNPQSLYAVAEFLGLPRKRPAPRESRRAPAPKPPADPSSTLLALSNKPRPIIEEDELEARAMLEAGRSIAYVAEWFGWDLARARDLARRLAEERRRSEAA